MSVSSVFFFMLDAKCRVSQHIVSSTAMHRSGIHGANPRVPQHPGPRAGPSAGLAAADPSGSGRLAGDPQEGRYLQRRWACRLRFV